MLNVVVEAHAPRKLLREIPNGTFFDGRFHYSSRTLAGPFLKVGSVSEKTWVVVRLKCMEGIVWVSGRDENTSVLDFTHIPVREVVLREWAVAKDREAGCADADRLVADGETKELPDRSSPQGRRHEADQ